MYVSNAQDLKRYLARPTQYEYLNVVAMKGAKLVFSGVKWLPGLEVQAEKGGTIEFPDLELIAEDLILVSPLGGTISIPKLKEVGNNFDAGVYDNDLRSDDDIKHEFDCFDAVESGEVILPEKFFVSGTLYSLKDLARNLTKSLDRWEPLANDLEYTLYYHLKAKRVKAGCHTFDSIGEAIRYWKQVQEDPNVRADYPDRENRALMFILALMNLREALK